MGTIFSSTQAPEVLLAAHAATALRLHLEQLEPSGHERGARFGRSCPPHDEHSTVDHALRANMRRERPDPVQQLRRRTVPIELAVGWAEPLCIRGALLGLGPELRRPGQDLGEQLETLMAAGARIFQFDVGDGHFVEPITIGPVVLKSISPLVHRLGGVLDCHLMTESPEKHFRAIADAGGDSVTLHYEACEDLAGVIAQGRELELGVGVAFNPETEPDVVVAAAGELVDLVLCMSIHPGYSGQEFMPEAIPRVRRLRELLPESVHVQVDGGVGADNVRELREAGANLFVAGTSVFGQEDLAEAYRRLVQVLG